MPKTAKKATKKTTNKARSDIFIYRLESGAYSAHPSPFIIHPGVDWIWFRNLTNDSISLQMNGVPVSPSTFSLRPNRRKKVTVTASPQAGIYEYKVRFRTPPPPPGVRQLHRTYAQGASSPKMIVDA
jgi:hypothetical protein